MKKTRTVLCLGLTLLLWISVFAIGVNFHLDYPCEVFADEAQVQDTSPSNQGYRASRVQVVDIENDKDNEDAQNVGSYDYPENKIDRKDFSVSLWVKGLDFSDGDSITYSYRKKGKTGLAYSPIKFKDEKEVKTITKEDIEGVQNKTKEEKQQFLSSIEFKPFANAKQENISVTYSIIAHVFRDDDLLQAEEYTLKIQFPEEQLIEEGKLSLFISDQHENAIGGGLGVYHLYAKFEIKGEGEGESKGRDLFLINEPYQVSWYELDEKGLRKSEIPNSNKASLIFFPKQSGYYKFQVLVKKKGLTGECADGSIIEKEYPISVVYDQSISVGVYCLVFALALTVIVVLTTVVKVRRERIW